MEQLYLLAVEGSLRKNMEEQTILFFQKYIGSFHSDPIYDMYSFNKFPSIIKDGDTSIYFEVYEVSSNIMSRLNRLNSYSPGKEDTNFYNLEEIDTPYGTANAYFFNQKINEKNEKIICGDWKKYKEQIITK